MNPDPLEWLESGSLYPKVFWQSRKGDLTLAGMGASEETNQVPYGSKKRYFGGLSFCEKQWDDFPACYFFVPKYVLESNSRHQPLLQPFSFTRKDSIDREGWAELVSEQLRRIRNKDLDKVVLARRTTLTFTQPPSPWKLLQVLRERTHNVTLFGFQFNPHSAFIGATPEKLYERKGNILLCDVLAATAPLHQAHLLHNKKERLEFEYVKQFVQGILSSLCETTCLGEDRIFSTATLHHLYNCVQGTLLRDVTDALIIAALHPTPAMAGLPRQKALSLIKEHEQFARGWYAAPIGWIEKNEADLAIGIRSAQLVGDSLHLYAATGIVEGSDPLLEWEELENKISPILKLVDLI